MVRQILKVNENGRWFTVHKTDDQYNPYRVYNHSWVQKEWNIDGVGVRRYITESKKLVGKYADMRSVMLLLASQF